ncbi:MAG TPA: hypothetical protein DCQ06_02945 [Myxococcales bacterium]|nr:hypothetical protein [Myxococcales bacterium]
MSHRLSWLIGAGWAFAGGWFLVSGMPVLVDVMQSRWSLHFAHPQWLWLMACVWMLPVLMWRTLNDLPWWQQGLQLGLRSAMIGALCIALAIPQGRQQTPVGAQVIHLVDMSLSMPKASVTSIAQSIDASLQRYSRNTDGTWQPAIGPSLQVDLVAFAGQATELPWPTTLTKSGASTLLDAVDHKTLMADQSDLEGAANLALALAASDRVTHVVIWTDGVETRGDLASLTQRLRIAGIRVHRPKDWSATASGEVVVEQIVVPKGRIFANLPFALHVDLRSSHKASVECQISGPGQMPKRVRQSISSGKTRLVMGRARLRSGGVFDLKATCRILKGPDRFETNNQVRARVVVQQRPKILYLEGAPGQSRYLTKALSDDYEVVVRGAHEVPRRAAQLRPYGAVILSDVGRISRAGVPQLTNQEMRALESYVRQGGGLLVVGGENSLGSGGYQGTYLDKHVLPVRMDIDSATEQPSVAMMLCLDRSGSMSGVKIELAKEAARATAEALDQEDRIGVIAFDNIARPTVRLQRAGNRFRIASRINKVSAGGGTHIYPALQQAYQALERTEAKVKHVILLSDGHASRAGIDALVQQMRRAAITVSTVGIGSSVDRDLLEAIADRGGGRSYFTDRPETLPRIFVRETRKVAGQSVIERRVRARRAPGAGRVDLLRGVPLRSAPALVGFVASKVKPGAEEILRLSSGAPLLVRWRLGLGRVSVWTSDLKNRWAHRWLDWSGYAILARQMIRDLLQQHMGVRLQLQLTKSPERIDLAVDARDEDDQWLTGLKAKAIWTLPKGERKRHALQEVAPVRYEGHLPLSDVGAYDVRVELSADNALKPIAQGSSTLVHPYPAEYRIGDLGQRMDSICKATGGASKSSPKTWHSNRGKSLQHQQDRWAIWVWIALGLFVLELTLRRIRLGPSRPIQWYS